MTLTAQAISLTGRLNAVSAELHPGQVTAICGPNGAGKSSLLATLAGLLTPDSGKVFIEGKPIISFAPRARAGVIGYLPQTAELAWDVTVQTLVALGRLPFGDHGEAAIARALASLDLELLRHRHTSTLSGGERARALLARVLAGEPRWVLADEPLANLDLAHALGLMRQFRQLADNTKGVVLVLHDLAMAINHADRVLVLNHGELVADGPPETALTSGLIGQVWGVDCAILGEPGRYALSIS